MKVITVIIVPAVKYDRYHRLTPYVRRRSPIGCHFQPSMIFSRKLVDTFLNRAPPRACNYGTFARSSSIHTRALPSDGARQSLRGDRHPPEEIFGPFGNADRLNWLIAKNRKRKTSSHRLISLSEYARRPSVGMFSGQRPRA